jgi:tRNA threonylcarbamoyladenosine biosynthesis protein TsaB
LVVSFATQLYITFLIIALNTSDYRTILAIESATSLCSIALWSDGVLHEAHVNAIGSHSSAIFVKTELLLSQAQKSIEDLDAVVLSVGPGSYTGLRVAASAVKGLLFQRDIPFFAANTLAGLALGINKGGRIHAIIDARRTHVYAQTFQVSEDSIIAETQAEIVDIADFYERLIPEDLLVGTGLKRLEMTKMNQVVTFPIEDTGARGLIKLLRIAARSSSELIKIADIASFEPDYLLSPYT